jgi:translation elongation factor EF-G
MDVPLIIAVAVEPRTKSDQEKLGVGLQNRWSARKR